MHVCDNCLFSFIGCGAKYNNIVVPKKTCMRILTVWMACVLSMYILYILWAAPICIPYQVCGTHGAKFSRPYKADKLVTHLTYESSKFHNIRLDGFFHRTGLPLKTPIFVFRSMKNTARYIQTGIRLEVYRFTGKMYNLSIHDNTFLNSKANTSQMRLT